MPTIKSLFGLEILDSRGRPTVKATCTLASGIVAQASVPSGASTGGAEAVELRDSDPQRYAGLGCRKAVGHINNEINAALSGRSFETQKALDKALLKLDGTADKSNLGANALLAVSLAFGRACATVQQGSLYDYFAQIADTTPHLPMPTINLFSGGKHAGGQVPIQDALIVPVAATTMDQAMEMTTAVYRAAATLIGVKYGVRLLTADEGGLAPPFPNTDDMFVDAVKAIEMAGYRPGEDVCLAIDVAATHFYEDGTYRYDGQILESAQMIETIRGWRNQYPIISIEDGLAEDDWAAWPALRTALGTDAITLGDDHLCTNPARIQRAIDERSANALLLKVNQIGTLTEAAQALKLARSAGWQVVVSARSGETEDDWLADLAVGWAGDYIKIGSITQSERLAKYNRLLEIEAITGLQFNAFAGGR